MPIPPSHRPGPSTTGQPPPDTPGLASVPDLAAVSGNPLDERTLMVTGATVGIGRLQGVDEAGTLQGHPVVKLAIAGKRSNLDEAFVDAFVDPATAAGLAQAITDALEVLEQQGNAAPEGPVRPNRAARRRRTRGQS